MVFIVTEGRRAGRKITPSAAYLMIFMESLERITTVVGYRSELRKFER
jgi:hypothetical protein